MNAIASFVMENGKVTKIAIRMNGGEMSALRLKDFDPTMVVLNDFAGDYYSPELNTTYTFIAGNGKLNAKHQRISDFNLTPAKTDIFNSNQWFFGQVEFTRDADGKVTGCRVSNGRVRNLRFEKVLIPNN